MIKPNAIAEKIVLSCILQDPNILPQAIGLLETNDFLTLIGRLIYQTCKDLFLENQPIDFATVNAKLNNTYTEHLIDIQYATPTTQVFKHNAELVKETSKRYKAHQKAQELITAFETKDLDDCRELMEKIFQSLDNVKDSDVLTLKDGMTQFFETKGKQREYLRTGFEKIDKYTYIDKGDYIVIGGRPSSGKTALTLHIGLNMAKTQKVVYFSLETKPSKLLDRIVANLTQTPLSEIKKGTIRKWENITKNIADIVNRNFTMVKAAGWTVAEIKAEAVRQNADVIFIDYLGLIKSYGKSRYEMTTNTSMDLHTLAQQSEMTVIALSQLKRNDSKTPTMQDLRESGQIEQDADAIMLLYQPEPDNPQRKVYIAKNKEGETGEITFHFEGIYQKFYEEVDR